MIRSRDTTNLKPDVRVQLAGTYVALPHGAAQTKKFPAQACFDAPFQDGITIRPKPERVCDGQVRRTGERSHTSADHDVSWLFSAKRRIGRLGVGP